MLEQATDSPLVRSRRGAVWEPASEPCSPGACLVSASRGVEFATVWPPVPSAARTRTREQTGGPSLRAPSKVPSAALGRSRRGQPDEGQAPGGRSVRGGTKSRAARRPVKRCRRVSRRSSSTAGGFFFFFVRATCHAVQVSQGPEKTSLAGLARSRRLRAGLPPDTEHRGPGFPVTSMKETRRAPARAHRPRPATTQGAHPGNAGADRPGPLAIHQPRGPRRRPHSNGPG